MSYDLHQRRAGVLLHPTSFPSGKLGDAARWLDFLEATGLSVWQVLPLGVPQDDLSPYQCLSAFAGNPALLDEMEMLDAASGDFRAYCREQHYWLEDYALFRIIKELQQDRAWFQWPEELKWRNHEALAIVSETHADALLELKWEQYQLHNRWQALKQEAHRRNIRLFGDMPIFVAHDSADVWANPKRFLLDEQGLPAWVTGVPPDYFSETGQRWGNPHYDWEYHKEENFDWWVARMRNHFEWFDLVRIDHFRGLQAVWMIDADAGPKADLGPIAIKGADAVDPDFIRTYSRLKAGQAYSPEELTDAANRLRTLKTFDSVVINTGDSLDENGQLPTTITVKDGKFRYFGFG
ncbi:MAG: hypothetical protein DSZ01_04130, partial [Gammaproteobacteria bacterium]